MFESTLREYTNTFINYMADSDVAECMRYASSHHDGQVRKGSNDAYFTHCLRVAHYYTLFSNRHTKEGFMACLLHDIVEDTDITIEEIGAKYGQLVMTYVDLLTKKEDQSHNQYFNELKNHDDFQVRLIKLCDLFDNVTDMNEIDDTEWVNNQLKMKQTSSYKLKGEDVCELAASKIEEATSRQMTTNVT